MNRILYILLIINVCLFGFLLFKIRFEFHERSLDNNNSKLNIVSQENYEQLNLLNEVELDKLNNSELEELSSQWKNILSNDGYEVY